jgi:hypothetical protein
LSGTKEIKVSGASMPAKELAQKMLGLLPSDGTPVLNRIMRVMLSRQLQQEIDSDLFFQARDLLLESGQIGRLRGQGGQLFLNQKSSSTAIATPPHTPGKAWTEAELMTPFGTYLSGAFKDGLDLSKDSECIVQDTSKVGPTSGRWARPDFIAVTAMRFSFLPGTQVDVHSFELKTETGADNLAVYEALAQTRFTNFGHLVWHLPTNSKAETRLPEIQEQCDAHGVGLIRMRDPNLAHAYEILLDPVRKPTLMGVVDGFLESRLNASHREKLAGFIHGPKK